MMEYLKKYKLIVICFVGILFIFGIFVYLKKPVTKKTTPVVVVNSTTPAVVSTKIIKPIITPAKTIPVPLPIGTDRFIVSLADTPETISANLLSGGYISDATAFTNLIGTKIISPGAYKISKGWTLSQMLQVLSAKPYMKWVLIPPGLRKEEIASLLASTLGWTKKQIIQFNQQS